ncbi:MAG: DUF2490 domain-containing protein [Flavitalea sp.]
MLRVFMFLFVIFSINHQTRAQLANEEISPWIMPGSRSKFSNNVTAWVQPGWNPQQHLYILYSQLFIQVNKYFEINPGHMFIKAGDLANVDLRDESTFFHAVILKLPFKKFSIDNRFMIWSRFRSDLSNDHHLYRNRIRLLIPAKFKSGNCRFYLFDEQTYDLNRSRWSRNRLALGASVDVNGYMNVDLSYARQWDVPSGRLNLLFIMVTLNLSAYRSVNLN